MRFAVVETIYQKAVKNRDIVFLTGDLGHALEKEFKINLPRQYYNVGIAEQNMIGMAAGLALAGKKVFAYSIAPFVTMRPYEQVKVDLCYQNLDVTLIGMGGGLIYGPYGNTHCSVEDIGAMRILPNMKIVCPANPLEAKLVTEQLMNIKGPTYLRIGRGKEPMPEKEYDIKFGKGQIIKKGSDIAIFSTGTILDEVKKTADLLGAQGIDAEIINMHTVKPIDEKLISDRINARRALFTVEEHNVIGGLGSAVAEIISESAGKKIIFRRFGIKDKYLHEVGEQKYLWERHEMSSAIISRTILQLLKSKI